MAIINKLKIYNLRNIAESSLIFNPRYNFFFGNNGSGKTSILEALYLLAMGRSFRSYLKDRIVSHQQRELTLYAELIETNNRIIKLGFSKLLDGKAKLRIDGEYCRRLAEAAKLLPVLLIDPNSYDLLEKGPKERRQYLDWGLFHVKPAFYEVSNDFQRCLKQRNAALKSQQSKSICQTWDKELSGLAQKLTEYRKNYFTQLQPYFADLLKALSLNMEIKADYYRGWTGNEEICLFSALGETWNKDFALGYTSCGPQKADIVYQVNGVAAEDVLSRGQMKLVVSALQFAQGKLYTELTGQNVIYLIDDLASELDKDNREKLFALLEQMSGQVFITATDRDIFSQISAPNTMFHVKHGEVNLA